MQNKWKRVTHTVGKLVEVLVKEQPIRKNVKTHTALSYKFRKKCFVYISTFQLVAFCKV